MSEPVSIPEAAPVLPWPTWFVVLLPAIRRRAGNFSFVLIFWSSELRSSLSDREVGHGREQGGVQSHNDKASTERRTGWSASIYECASRGEHAAETTEVRLIGSGGGERTSYPRVACSGNSIHGDRNNDIITFGYT